MNAATIQPCTQEQMRIYDGVKADVHKAIFQSSLLLRVHKERVLELEKALEKGCSSQSLAATLIDIAHLPERERSLLQPLLTLLDKAAQAKALFSSKCLEGKARLDAIEETLRTWVESGKGSDDLIRVSQLMSNENARFGLASFILTSLAACQNILKAHQDGYVFGEVGCALD